MLNNPRLALAGQAALHRKLAAHGDTDSEYTVLPVSPRRGCHWVQAEVESSLGRSLHHLVLGPCWLQFLRHVPRAGFTRHSGARGRGSDGGSIEPCWTREMGQHHGVNVEEVAGLRP